MKIYLLLFCFFLFNLRAENLVKQVDLQVHSTSNAYSYAEAFSLYEPLLADSLPLWQKERLKYNMGTLKLLQGDFLKALSFFKEIQFNFLQLPRFIGDVLLNQGIAYLKYAETLLSEEKNLVGWNGCILKQSQLALQKSLSINCEKDFINLSTCIAPVIQHWLLKAEQISFLIQQQKKLYWIKGASSEKLIVFLQDSLQKMIDIFSFFLSQNLSSQTAYLEYMQQQLESFIPIWNEVNTANFSIKNKKIFDKAALDYLNIMQSIESLSEKMQKIIQVEKLIATMDFPPFSLIEKILMMYEIILLQENLTEQAIINLQKAFSDAETTDGYQKSDSFDTYLKISRESVQQQQKEKAYFFLLVGYYESKKTIDGKLNSPIQILTKAIEHANFILQLLYLQLLIKPEKEMSKIIIEQQKHLQSLVDRFVPVVLEEQKKLFAKGVSLAEQCQDSPWNQALPLFAKGFTLLQKTIAKKMVSVPEVIYPFQRIVQYWEEALVFLKTPLSKTSPHSAQNMTETFRLLQEMYMEDQMQNEFPMEELQTW